MGCELVWEIEQSSALRACHVLVPRPSAFFLVIFLGRWLFSHSVVSDYLPSHGLQHIRFPCPSLSPWVCSSSYPLGQWCHPTILSSAIPFFFCPQSFPGSGSFPVSWLFLSGGQSIGVSASASVLPMNIQGWFPLGLTGLISLLSKGLSRVSSSASLKTSVLRHSALRSDSLIRTWLLEKPELGPDGPVLAGWADEVIYDSADWEGLGQLPSSSGGKAKLGSLTRLPSGSVDEGPCLTHLF